MSARTVPPFRADHVGSVLRPAKLHAARTEHAGGAITDEQLRAVEDEAVREVVARELKSFAEQEALVSLGGGRYRVGNPDGLRRIAAADGRG